MIILSLVLAIGAVGLNVIMGFGGYISLGQSAFIGLGAYTVGIATTKIGGDPFVWVPVAGRGRGAVRGAAGADRDADPRLRLRDHHDRGAVHPPDRRDQLGLAHQRHQRDHAAAAAAGTSTIQNWPFYYALAGLLGASLLLAWWIRRTKIGTGLLAIREDEDKAATIGINTPVYKIIGFVASAVFLGMAGGIYGYYLAFIDPIGMFDIVVSVQIILAVVLGGRGTLWGPVLGAAIIEPLNEFANQQFGGGNSRLLIFGGLLALTILLLPKGIIPSVRELLERRAKRGRAALVGARLGERKPFGGAAPAGPGAGGTLLEVKGLEQQLRGRARRRRLLVRGRARDDHRPDRPERLRQDHDLQPDRRHDARRRGRGLARRGANRPGEALGASVRRDRQDLPDHPGVRRHDRARERGRAAAQLLLGPAARRRGQRRGGESRRRAARVRRHAGVPRPAGRGALVRAAEAGRAGAGADARPEADPARRAGGRHQPDPDRADGGDDPRAQRTRARRS